MAVDPYKAGLIKTGMDLWEKSDIPGKLVLAFDIDYEKRELKLIPQPTRALLKYEIHELLVTDENEAGPGKVVNRISGIGFFEITQGGIILVGDKLLIKDKYIGEVVGFDETHMPNHLNIVMRSEKKNHGIGLGLHPGDEVLITQRVHFK